MMNAQSIGRALGDTSTDQPMTAVFVVVCYLWMDISVNVIQTSANLIIADFSGYKQVTGFAIASSYGVVGSMFVSGFIWTFGPAHQSTQWFFLMLIGVVLITVFPVCAFVTEVPLAYLPHDRTSSMMWQYAPGGQSVLRFKDAALGFYRGVRYLPRQLAVFCVVVVCVTYGFNAYNGAKSVYWGEYVFNGTSTNANTCDPTCSPAQGLFNDGAKLAGGPVDTAFNIVSLINLALLPSLVGRFGARRVLLWSTTPQILLVIMTFSRIVVLDIIVVTLCAVSQSTIMALQIPAVMHVIGYGEQEGLGLYAGAFNSAICVGQLLNFALSSVLVSTPMGPALPILLGGILSLAAFLIVRKHFTLHMKTY
ncbi:hypothetical protein DYB32_002689 [Aphanomyces invadans]|nr:hypothetical protein DYB32_002689 [Aphanomyces invadans]